MRQQIAAANWKMNLSLSETQQLIEDLLCQSINLQDHQQMIVAVPYIYLLNIQNQLKDIPHFFVSAQNVSANNNGAFTGEISAAMLRGIGIQYVIIGHSERREYYHETPALLVEKLNRAFEYDLTPIFCCGEPLQIREASTQNNYVTDQLKASLFHLNEDQIGRIIISYEPIWAIGTGKTASSEQAQEMHAHIRNVIASKYGNEIAQKISVLYGGSVKASNAKELFAKPDIDGGLVGGASLNAIEFAAIVNSLKK